MKIGTEIFLLLSIFILLITNIVLIIALYRKERKFQKLIQNIVKQYYCDRKQVNNNNKKLKVIKEDVVFSNN